MGPWLVFAALLNGAAIALFNGPPLARPFGEFVDAARVTMLGLVPSIVRAWRGSDCMQVIVLQILASCLTPTMTRRQALASTSVPLCFVSEAYTADIASFNWRVFPCQALGRMYGCSSSN